jgi:hypothetical protein
VERGAAGATATSNKPCFLVPAGERGLFYYLSSSKPDPVRSAADGLPVVIIFGRSGH